MKKILLATVGTLVFSSFITAYAATADIFTLENAVLPLLSKLAGLLIVLAIMLFFWGLVRFISNASDAKAHEEGKKLILWGLISLLVIFSLWAIVGVILSDLGIVSPTVNYVTVDGTIVP